MVCFFFISLSLWLLFVFHLFVGVKHAPAIPSYTPLQGPAPFITSQLQHAVHTDSDTPLLQSIHGTDVNTTNMHQSDNERLEG